MTCNVARSFASGKYYLYDPELVTSNVEDNKEAHQNAINIQLFLFGNQLSMVEIKSGKGYCGSYEVPAEYCLCFDRYEELAEYLFN